MNRQCSSSASCITTICSIIRFILCLVVIVPTSQTGLLSKQKLVLILHLPHALLLSPVVHGYVGNFKNNYKNYKKQHSTTDVIRPKNYHHHDDTTATSLGSLLLVSLRKSTKQNQQRNDEIQQHQKQKKFTNNNNELSNHQNTVQYNHRSKQHQNQYSIMTWNILAPAYAPYEKYAHCNPKYVDWKYRKQSIINRIQEASPDIVFLQEVQMDQWQKQTTTTTHTTNNVTSMNETNDKKEKLVDEVVDPNETVLIDGDEDATMIQNNNFMKKIRKMKNRELHQSKEKYDFEFPVKYFCVDHIEDNNGREDDNEIMKPTKANTTTSSSRSYDYDYVVQNVSNDHPVACVILYKSTKFRLHRTESRSRALIVVLEPVAPTTNRTSSRAITPITLPYLFLVNCHLEAGIEQDLKRFYQIRSLLKRVEFYVTQYYKMMKSSKKNNTTEATNNYRNDNPSRKTDGNSSSRNWLDWKQWQVDQQEQQDNVYSSFYPMYNKQTTVEKSKIDPYIIIAGDLNTGTNSRGGGSRKRDNNQKSQDWPIQNKRRYGSNGNFGIEQRQHNQQRDIDKEQRSIYHLLSSGKVTKNLEMKIRNDNKYRPIEELPFVPFHDIYNNNHENNRKQDTLLPVMKHDDGDDSSFDDYFYHGTPSYKAAKRTRRMAQPLPTSSKQKQFIQTTFAGGAILDYIWASERFYVDSSNKKNTNNVNGKAVSDSSKTDTNVLRTTPAVADSSSRRCCTIAPWIFDDRHWTLLQHQGRCSWPSHENPSDHLPIGAIFTLHQDNIQ